MKVELLMSSPAIECVFDSESDRLGRLRSVVERVVDDRQSAW